MPLIQLTSDNIGDLDGGLAREIINKELARAVADFCDRGEEDGKERKVTIEIVIIHQKKRACIDVKAKATIPPYRSGMTVASLDTKAGGEMVLAFRDDNPEAADQPTLPFEEREAVGE